MIARESIKKLMPRDMVIKFAILLAILMPIAFFSKQAFISILIYWAFVLFMEVMERILIEKLSNRREVKQTLDLEIGKTDVKTDYILKQIFVALSVSNEKYLLNMRMLVDTGFTGDLSLPSSIIKKLGLTPQKNKITVITSIGRKDCPYYVTDLKLSHKVLKNITVIESQSDEENYGIIGLRIISQGELNVKKDGSDYNYSFKLN